ncbi:uncharacterized protein LAESUDRAFT_644482 [Laetiporus sulphureus 93-53]|uniref:Protein N-terminal and lysine N-methyltransferase EFM7 n=1 Tax=Laetiporus sulphureus 93-53 TaxID=1314785 RepID=A0A165GME3_9APHY|nr:uncharacterized protein LAESUDRAFT_644482 [Laetiporus sulphureus 93-53]KZT10552.1 hypothetical protein LAESUDRAFT_644482 [Laetiporus sulphureus 93-53]
MSDSEGEPSLALNSIFTEPLRAPSPEPTISIYQREAANSNTSQDTYWSKIEIRLVGSHPLWGHHLWNASRAFASYLDVNPELYRDRAVLELGAGGGLPGLVTALNGAHTVVLTDYPDASLLDNLKHNVETNIPSTSRQRVHVQGYIWGRPIGPLLKPLDGSTGRSGYDLIMMSDLIFNHSQHDALLQTCEQALSSSSRDSLTTTPEKNATFRSGLPSPCLLVFYTHHRPHLAHRDMDFFSKARQRGWLCEEILTQKFPPMFPDDPGDEEVRSTVHGWMLTRAKS